MKKTYISPTTFELHIELQGIIAASKFDDPTKPTQDLTLSEDPSGQGYGGEFHSRRNNIWDDEEELDEE